MPEIDAKTRESIQTAIRFSEAGKYPESIQVLEKGLSKKPDSSLLHMTLGNVYAQMGNWQKSLYHYLLCVQLDPTEQANLRNQIGLAYFNLGEFNSAIAELKYGVANDPGNLGRWFLAVCYHKTGCLQEAFNEYKILLTSYQGLNLAITHCMIADLYRTKGQVDDAIIELKKGLSIAPNMGEAHDWLGKCYEQKGLMDESKSEYQIAKKLGYNASEISKR